MYLSVMVTDMCKQSTLSRPPNAQLGMWLKYTMIITYSFLPVDAA